MAANGTGGGGAKARAAAKRVQPTNTRTGIGDVEKSIKSSSFGKPTFDVKGAANLIRRSVAKQAGAKRIGTPGFEFIN